jgi:CRISPR-associated protein Cas1
MEGNTAQSYFRVFDELILQNKNDFSFKNRNRRPPKDPINAMLSLAYTLLAAECRHGLEVVGLDAFVGFMHTDRHGRPSLALDLMEELRPQFADRFVLSLINRREMLPNDFEVQESGAVLITSDAKKKFLAAWQQRKKEEIRHPFLDEKIEWGLVPYVQGLLLARVIRKDLDKYPPFLWK